MSITSMDEFNEEDMKTRGEKLAYACGKVMERIGKMPMWNDWVNEAEMYLTEKTLEDYWEERCKEAWSAETTRNLTPEDRVEHMKMIENLKAKMDRLTYEAGCASVMAWEEMLDEAGDALDEAYYWHTQIARMETIIWEKAQKKIK